MLLRSVSSSATCVRRTIKFSKGIAPLSSAANLRLMPLCAQSHASSKQIRFYSTDPSTGTSKIKHVMKNYGPTFFGLSLVIGPVCLVATVVVISVIDIVFYFPSLLEYQTASTLALALVIHKLWSPIRLSIVAMMTPYVAKMNRDNSKLVLFFDNLIESVPALQAIRQFWEKKVAEFMELQQNKEDKFSK